MDAYPRSHHTMSPSSKIFYLSSEKPWDALYTTEEGFSLYKTEAPSSLKRVQYTKILRAIPSLQQNSSRICETSDESLKDSFGLLAEIEYHTFHAARIRYGGEEKSVDEFFSKKGFNVYGKNHIFRGHDGIEYLWKMESDKCKLFVNDSTKTLVANFHQMRRGILQHARPAFLEIFGEGLDERMVDQIVVTFVYMERFRKELQDAIAATA